MGELYLGLDIGGSNVRIAAMDSFFNRIGNIHKVQFKKFNTALDEVEENICRLIEEVIRINQIDKMSIKTVGISLAALFERASGRITNWPNNKRWNGFSLKEYLTNRFHIPFFFEDDANCAALGELHHGVAKGYNSFAYITISTGIGCGLVFNGKLHIGTNGWAGEIGHIKIRENDVICTCGATGCLQSLASGPALLLKAKQMALNYGFAKNGEVNDLKEVVAYARIGEKWALRVFDEAGYDLADAISKMVMLLDLPLVVLGGGVAAAGEILVDPIKKALKSRLDYYGREIEVKIAECAECGVLGALALARNNADIQLIY